MLPLLPLLQPFFHPLPLFHRRLRFSSKLLPSEAHLQPAPLPTKPQSHVGPRTVICPLRCQLCHPAAMRLFPVSAAHCSVQATFCFLSFGCSFFSFFLLSFCFYGFCFYYVGIFVFVFVGRLFADQINCLIIGWRLVILY